ncbi:MAG: hybrid sensor histidine kinase/response regulator [Thermoleophilia bacterium]
MDNWSADKEFLQTFRAEAEERLRNLGEGLMALEGNPGDEELVKKLFREAHTLKGASGMMGFDSIRELSHRVEDILSAVQKQQLALDKSLTDLMLETLDSIEAMLPEQSTGEIPEVDASELLARLVRASSGEMPGGSGASAAETEIAPMPKPDESAGAAIPLKRPIQPVNSAPAQEPAAKISDVPEKDVKPVPKKAATPVAARARTREADPTIRVNIERLDRLMNLMGEILVNQIDSEGQVRDMAGLQQEMHDLRDIFSSLMNQVERMKEQSGPDELASLNQSLSEAESRAEKVASEIDTAASRFKENTAVRRLALDELQDRTMHVRMLPLSNIFGIYPRVVREASNACGKKVRLETSGEDTELDKRILEQVADPLIHIIRNCVDHGIESPETRRAAGKDEQGIIRLAAFQRGDRVEIEIEDDGAGIDPGKVRQKALEKGLVSEDEDFGIEDCTDLIFLPGFSTATSITEISGRGVGLDVVKSNIEKLEGSVSVVSTGGAGTRFTVSLPVTLAVIKGLLVESNDIRLIIPLVSVKEMVAVPEEEIQTLGSRRGFLMRDSAVPLIDLLEHLGGGVTVNSGDKSNVVIVGADKFRLGFAVGSLLGEQEVVIKSLGTFLGRLDYVAGVSILGSGEAVVVLNVNHILRKIKEGVRAQVREIQQDGPQKDERRKSVLIVEDSLVVRELQRNILEAAGYDVDTAVDGEDALARLAQKAVDCVVTDIEMPRMNGFDLTSAIRKKDDLKDTPIIMVTSCSSDSDKKRGIEVGANAYVIKGSFDQQKLLTTIERLVA